MAHKRREAIRCLDVYRPARPGQQPWMCLWQMRRDLTPRRGLLGGPLLAVHPEDASEGIGAAARGTDRVEEWIAAALRGAVPAMVDLRGRIGGRVRQFRRQRRVHARV